jgi:hypothetical protein
MMTLIYTPSIKFNQIRLITSEIKQANRQVLPIMDSLYTRRITLPRWINANMCVTFFRQNSFCAQLFKHQAMNIYGRVAV